MERGAADAEPASLLEAIERLIEVNIEVRRAQRHLAAADEPADKIVAGKHLKRLKAKRLALRQQYNLVDATFALVFALVARDVLDDATYNRLAYEVRQRLR